MKRQSPLNDGHFLKVASKEFGIYRYELSVMVSYQKSNHHLIYQNLPYTGIGWQR